MQATQYPLNISLQDTALTKTLLYTDCIGHQHSYCSIAMHKVCYVIGHRLLDPEACGAFFEPWGHEAYTCVQGQRCKLSKEKEWAGDWQALTDSITLH